MQTRERSGGFPAGISNTGQTERSRIVFKEQERFCFQMRPNVRIGLDRKRIKYETHLVEGALKLQFAEAAATAPLQLREVEFIDMPVRRILNRCDSPRMPFRWTLNPYRGCEFGCVYCYARYTHEFLEERDPMAFERRIFVKRGAAEALARNLAHSAIGDDQIALGTATDPYQPAERRFELTRSMLEVFARIGGINLAITTKSPLIVRDLELLREINRRSKLSVNFSLITLSRRLQRVLEPRAARPALRLRAIRELSGNGIRCNILIMPVIPEITDGPAALENVIKAARWAGAAAVWWRTLFLKPAAARRFLPFIQEHFPDKIARFEEYYGRKAYAPQDYDARIGALFDELRRRYGFDHQGERTAPRISRAPARGEQLNLL